MLLGFILLALSLLAIEFISSSTIVLKIYRSELLLIQISYMIKPHVVLRVIIMIFNINMLHSAALNSLLAASKKSQNKKTMCRRINRRDSDFYVDAMDKCWVEIRTDRWNMLQICCAAHDLFWMHYAQSLLHHRLL